MGDEMPVSSPSEPALLMGQSGFVTSGSGLPAGESGVITVVLGVVLGAMCGMLGGIVVAHLSRYLSMITGRHLWGGRWVLIGTVAGGLVLGLKACLDSKE